MKQIRTRLTYANVMSSIAVFLVLGGATAFAAATIGTGDIKAGAIKTGKIAKEAVKAGKLGNGAVKTEKIADAAVTTPKIADNAVTGAKVDEASLGEVPNAANAANAAKIGGQAPGSFVARNELLWAVVLNDGTLNGGSGAVAATKTSAGRYTVTFNRTITACVTEGTATDVTGGEPPLAAGARIIGTDNRIQENANASKVNVTTTNPAGVLEDPEGGDGFTVTVYC